MAQTHKTFISFHNSDESYKLNFEKTFSNILNVFISKSVNTGDIVSNIKTDTIRQKIRDSYLRDSSVTTVLVGLETWKRKHVDWEISSSIRHTQYNSRSGLLGILLPTYLKIYKDSFDPFTIPPRLYENVKCKYANLYYWPETPSILSKWIHEAFLRRQTINPDNSFPMFANNRSGMHWQY